MKALHNYLGLFASDPVLEIQLIDPPSNKFFKTKNEKGEKIKLPAYNEKNKIKGNLLITLPNSKKFQHKGIRCGIFGHLQIRNQENQSTTFYHEEKILVKPGTINEFSKIEFLFDNFKPTIQSYEGIQAKIKYSIIAKLIKNQQTSFKAQKQIGVILDEYKINKNIQNLPVKMEIGIQPILNMTFEYNKSIYHLKDCILGKMYFEKIDIKIEKINLQIIRKQTTGLALTAKTEQKIVYQFQLADGCPRSRTQIPIRVYLSPAPLTPTYLNIQHRLQVNYFLNLQIIDEDGKLFFKQAKIILVRESK